MRFIRMMFIGLLAVVLIAVALANRQLVTLKLFPASVDQFIGREWAVDLPLFLIIFLAVAFGMVVGLVWEYLREAHLRREADRRSSEIARLKREVGHLRDEHAGPNDEILAIVDRPKATASAQHNEASGAARGAALPAPGGR